MKPHLQGRLLLVDNYDSFTFNLAQYLEQLGFLRGEKLVVVRNDELSLEQIMTAEPAAIMLSPGPGTPDDTGVGLELVCAAWGKIPLFGVCLGLQTIVQAMGGRVVRAAQVMHGKSSPVTHDAQGVFAGLSSPLQMGRYHSLIAEVQSLPESLLVSAHVAEPPQEIMAVRGRVRPIVEAVQFHPESVLSQQGHRILANFLEKAFGNTIIRGNTLGISMPEAY